MTELNISIVVPAFNAESFLGQTIQSVLAQTVTDWDLVIVDDGSTDSTAEQARAFALSDSRIRVVQQANGGIASARNRGFAETIGTAETVIFLDHDDVWENDALETLLSALAAQPRAVAASGLSRCINAYSQPIGEGELENWGRDRRGVSGLRLVPWPTDQPTTLAVLAYRNCILTPGQVLIRRPALQLSGLFDSAASPCDDWDMWLRLTQRGDIAHADRVVLSWRSHGHNASSYAERMVLHQRYVRAKLLSSPYLNDDQRRVVLAANSYWGRQLYAERLREAAGSIARWQFRRAAQQIRNAMRCYLRCLRGLAAC